MHAPRLVGFWVGLLTIGILSALGIGVAFSQGEDAPSPASGQAAVIAQGVTALPVGDVGWRVRLASTEAASEPAARDVPGFILVDQGALLVNDVDAGRQTRLAAGEATFLPAPATAQEAPLGNAPASSYRIELVAAGDVGDAGADQLAFIGEPFASPGGTRDLDLVRQVLDADESVDLELESYAAPALLLVTSGAVELVPAENPEAAPVRLAAGQGAGLGGNVVARAADGAEATFVTAIIGPEVLLELAQEAATPTPTPALEPASLVVQAIACPVAYEGTNYAADCAEPLADITFDLSAASGSTGQATTGADGTVTFVDLVPDTYTLTGGVPGEFATQAVQCAADAGSVPSSASQTDVPGATLTLDDGDAVTCRWFVIPENLRGENEGTVAVSVHLCPATPEDPNTDCELGDATGVVIDGPVVLTSDDASAIPVSIQGASWVWGEEGGLPFGTYFLQPGGIPVPEGYELSEVRGSAGASDNGWTFTVDETTPEAILNVIYTPTTPIEDVDSDQDGVGDAEEATLGIDPANPDSDADGLLDGAEVSAGTDPTLNDTDGDGFGDNAEVANSTDPNDPASVPPGEPTVDTDGDGLSDAQEVDLGTNPELADSDGDGLSDLAEVGFEPGSATGTDPLLVDTDGDGAGDGDEVANGTDPIDPASA